MKPLLLLAASVPLIALFPNTSFAHDGEQHVQSTAMDHAPIGVMADHRHKKGEWMLSYRYMNMDMEGNRDGTNSLSSDDIVTTVANPFFGGAGQPATLRVVPENMTMDMQMIGAMYGLTDRVTLMGMTSYITKDMDHTTYMGGSGTTVLGSFNTKTEGFGDTTIGAIIGLEDILGGESLNLNLAVSLPTGSIVETDQILTPMGGTPSPRLPYAMQLGTGTVDFKPSVTYSARAGKIGWGSQIGARIPLNDTVEGYEHGKQVTGTAWLAYEPRPNVSLSGRLAASSVGSIDGLDTNITLPVQTADPDNYGGEQVTALIGVNLLGQNGLVKGHRLAAEFGLPLYRDLNGPQMETDSTLTLAWQKAF